MTARQSKATTAANRRLVGLIREAFDASSMNRMELAERSGVPDGTLAKIFSGRAPVYAEQLVGLSDALDIPFERWLREMRAARDDSEGLGGVETEGV